MMGHTRTPWRPPNSQPQLHYDIVCYRKVLDKTLRITAQPILPPLHERALQLVNNPWSDQDECKEVVHAILDRRHTAHGIEEREQWAALEHHERDDWLKHRNLHHIVKPKPQEN